MLHDGSFAGVDDDMAWLVERERKVEVVIR